MSWTKETLPRPLVTLYLQMEEGSLVFCFGGIPDKSKFNPEMPDESFEYW